MNKKLTAGEVFKSARVKKNLTQIAVAEKAEIHPNTYAKIERNEQEPSFDTVKRLAKVLDLKLENIPS
jgi:transcriptional regulator with XRE-family HTH domain